jgi:hypothetical protein
MKVSEHQIAFDFSVQPKVSYCSHCHRRLGRPERLSKGLARALATFYTIAEGNTNRQLHLVTDCGFVNSVLTNFQKLQYFSLIERGAESGFWKLTDAGAAFIENRLRVPKKVFLYKKAVVEKSSELVSVQDVMQTAPFWNTKEFYVQGAG